LQPSKLVLGIAGPTFEKYGMFLKVKEWLTPVILATQETEIRRITVRS
jgi:hypothetical protein